MTTKEIARQIYNCHQQIEEIGKIKSEMCEEVKKARERAAKDPLQAEGVEVRTRVCAAEFVCEQLGLEPSAKDFKYQCRKVSGLIAGLLNWEPISTSRQTPDCTGRGSSTRLLCTG